MKPAIPRRHRNRQLRVFEMFRKRFTLGPIRLDPSPKRNPQAMRNGVHRFDDIAQPGPYSLHFIDHWAKRISYIDAAMPNVSGRENQNYKESAKQSATGNTRYDYSPRSVP